MNALNLNLLQAKGRSNLFLRLEVWKKILGVLILCATIPFGIFFHVLRPPSFIHSGTGN